MIDDKKRDRALQRRVRDRQEKTGESYQAAWRHLSSSDGADGDGADDNKNSNAADLPTSRRSPLSLSTNVRIRPGDSAQITGRPQIASFWPDRLLIKNADRWDIDQLTVGFHTAQASSLIKTKHSASEFALDVWQPLKEQEVLCGEEIVAVVTYNGPNEKGECFEAALFGWEGRPPVKPVGRKKHADADVQDRVSVRAESKPVVPCETIKLPLVVASPALYVDRLTIEDGKSWIVNDILVRGRSILVQAGDLPGDMFSGLEPVILEPLEEKDRVEIMATYVGIEAAARLVIELSGSEKAPSIPPVVSYFLPMSTGVEILPTQSAQITGRPQRHFLPERLVLANPDRWIVNSIRCGVRHQFADGGDIPGETFGVSTAGNQMIFDPLQAGQDFVIVTTHGEDFEVGAPFFCGAQGRLVRRV